MLLPDTIVINSVFFYHLPLSLNFLSLVLSLLMLITFMRFKRLRINSGNLILSILSTEFLFSAFLLANFFYVEESDIFNFHESGYNFSPEILPYLTLDKDDISCRILGVLFIFLIYNLFCLNCCLAHNLYTCVKYKGIQENKSRFVKYFIISLLISFSICIYAVLNKDIGSGELGYCGIKEGSDLEIIIFISLMLIFMFNIYVAAYVLVNKGKLMRSLKQENVKKSRDQNNDKNVASINNMTNSTTNKKNQALSAFGIENLRNSHPGKNKNSDKEDIKITEIDLKISDKEIKETEGHLETKPDDLRTEPSQNTQFAMSNFEVFIKINLSYIVVFMINWIPMWFLSIWSFWCVFAKSCDASTCQDVLRIVGMNIMCSNAIFLFLVRIKETHVKKKLTKLLFSRSKKGKKKSDNDIKSKLITHAIRNEKKLGGGFNKQTSINNTELSRFDSNFSFQMMMKSAPKERSPEHKQNINNENDAKEFASHLETRAVTMHTLHSLNTRELTNYSEEKAESMSDIMKIFLILPYMFDKLDKLLPESQFSEVLITSTDISPPPLETKVSDKSSKPISFLKAFTLDETKAASFLDSAKDSKKGSLKDQSNASSKKGSLKSPQDNNNAMDPKKVSINEQSSEFKKSSFKESKSCTEQTKSLDGKTNLKETKDSKKGSLKETNMKKSMFKQPPWTDYLYNKYYLEEVETSDLVKESLDLMSKFRLVKEKITCVAYNKEYFDWMHDFSNFDKDEIKKAFGVLENYDNIKNISDLKIDLEIKTADSRYFLKIIHKDVKKFLVEKYFKSYHLYINQQKKSFLPKIFGLFSFQFHNSNVNISFILYENPFIRYKSMQEKTDILGYLRINPLEIKKRIVFNEEKIVEHYHRSYSFTVKEDDLKLKKEEKSRMLEILKKDLEFLSNLQAVKYSFVLFFYKFNDKLILQALDSDQKEDIIVGKKHVISNVNITMDNEDFSLRNGIGYCIGTFYELFKFLKVNKKKIKSMEKSEEISQSMFSTQNAELYGQSMFDLVQEL